MSAILGLFKGAAYAAKAFAAHPVLETNMLIVRAAGSTASEVAHVAPATGFKGFTQNVTGDFLEHSGDFLATSQAASALGNLAKMALGLG